MNNIKKMKDERIMKEFDRKASKMYWYVIIVLFAMLIYKILYKMKLITYALELICIPASFAYLLYSLNVNRLFFVKNPDSCLTFIYPFLFEAWDLFCL